jgi:hypothetical protein
MSITPPNISNDSKLWLLGTFRLFEYVYLHTVFLCAIFHNVMGKT